MKAKLKRQQKNLKNQVPSFTKEEQKRRKNKEVVNIPSYWHLRSKVSKTLRQIGSSSTARTRIPTGNIFSLTELPPLWSSTVIMCQTKSTQHRDHNKVPNFMTA